MFAFKIEESKKVIMALLHFAGASAIKRKLFPSYDSGIGNLHMRLEWYRVEEDETWEYVPNPYRKQLNTLYSSVGLPLIRLYISTCVTPSLVNNTKYALVADCVANIACDFISKAKGAKDYKALCHSIFRESYYLLLVETMASSNYTGLMALNFLGHFYDTIIRGLYADTSTYRYLAKTSAELLFMCSGINNKLACDIVRTSIEQSIENFGLKLYNFIKDIKEYVDERFNGGYEALQ